MAETRDPLEVSYRNIWEYAQNRKRLIVEDILALAEAGELNEESIRRVLLARGVNKAFAMRRDFIRMKEMLRHSITERSLKPRELHGRDKTRNSGAINATHECYARVRRILHGPRWTERE